MYKLLISELAHDGLDQIAAYLAVHLSNPTAASPFLDQVDRCYRDLQTTPAMFEECHNRPFPYKRAILPLRMALLSNMVPSAADGREC